MAGIQELEDIFADPDNPGATDPEVTAALQLYEESRGRAETVPDIFGGEKLDTGVHAGAEGGKGDEVRLRTGAEGTVPSFPEVGEAGRLALDRLAKRWADRTGGNERGRRVLTRRAFQGTVKQIAKTLIVVYGGQASVYSCRFCLDCRPRRLLFQRMGSGSPTLPSLRELCGEARSTGVSDGGLPIRQSIPSIQFGLQTLSRSPSGVIARRELAQGNLRATGHASWMLYQVDVNRPQHRPGYEVMYGYFGQGRQER